MASKCIGNVGCQTISPEIAAHVLLHVGFTPDQAVYMVAIGMAESGLSPNKRGGPNSNGSYDWGVFQINWPPIVNPEKGPTGWSNPVRNARMAFGKFKTQGLNAWCTYEPSACGGRGNGAYRAHMSEARSAVSNATKAGNRRRAVASVNRDFATDEPYSTGASGALQDVGTGIVTAKEALESFGEAITSGETWVRVAEAVGGLLLVGIGVYVAVKT